MSAAGTLEAPVLTARSVPALGTTATVVVTDPSAADEAARLLVDGLAELDRSCSRFRADSELSRLEATASGRPTPVGPTLFEALTVAVEVAVLTAGVVDPTLGSALVDLGYDRDLAALTDDGPGGVAGARPAPGWWRLVLDPATRSVTVPDGVHVDLGATAKAWAADLLAESIAWTTGGGVLVNLGGDLAVAGSPPPGGWPVGIGPRCTTSVDDVDQVVTVRSGGLATSGTAARTWRRDGRTLHHILDPWTGLPAAPVWSLVSTAAPTCVEANAWSTAAVVWGADAPGILAERGVPARLVAPGGRTVLVGGWPPESGGVAR